MASTKAARERMERLGTDKPGRKVGSLHSELVRDRIRSSAIVNRLMAFVNGTQDPRTKKPLELSPAQVTAALGLLKKTIPDLQAIEHSGEVAQEVYMISAEPPTEEEWQAQYGGGQRLDS